MSKILIVDDDSGVLAAFEQILTEQGHAVITAERGDVVEELIKCQSARPRDNGHNACRV